MARRKRKPSGLERRELNSRAFNRSSGTISQIESVMIASEDTDSSVTYFKLILNELISDKKITPFSCVFAKHNNTHPTGVLNDLLSHVEKNGFTHKDFEHLWIVIDRDKRWKANEGHKESDFVQALKDAESNGVKVAYSNDSFELWYLLHFNYECSVTERKDLNDKVKGLGLVDQRVSLKSADFVKEIYPHLVGEPECRAIKNAQKLLEEHVKAGTEPHNANPSTTIHELVCLLRSLGKECQRDPKCEGCGLGCDCTCHFHCSCKDFVK